MSESKIIYKNLGESGLKIAPIIVGCMTYGQKSWANWVLEDEEEIFLILKRAYDAGLRTFDTADVYSNGKSEEVLGKFLKKYKISRNRVVILTKLFFVVDEEAEGFTLAKAAEAPAYEYSNAQGLSRKHILEAAENSVRRLGTYPDVTQIHRLDRSTPKKEIMRALNDIVDQGLTRYIGASSMKAVEFAELQFIADKNGWHTFISMQNYYNLIYREEEREMIPFCENSTLGRVGIIPWSPIARGILAKPLDLEKSSRGNSDKTMGRLGLDALTEADKEIVNRVEKLSKKLGYSMSAISTAWVISKGASPIVGLNSVKRVDDILTALDIKLSEGDIKYLEDPYIPKVPTGML